MKIQRPILLILGFGVLTMGLLPLIKGGRFGIASAIPFLMGIPLCYLGWKANRIAYLVFGHTSVVVGCFLIAWGIYVLPLLPPLKTLATILKLPLFWGLIAIFGGICSIFLGFCNCVRRSIKPKENTNTDSASCQATCSGPNK